MLTQRAEGAEVRDYTWNYAMQFPCLTVEEISGGRTSYYVYAPSGALLYRIDADTGDRQYYHFDETGNTVLITDDSGAAAGRYVYSPFGGLLDSEGGLDNPFTWQGQIGHFTEQGEDLYLMRARWYDASVARFLSRDPARRSILPSESNPYAYARLNPINYIDPLGTRARVIASGVHTDLEVDIWEGDKIIGRLQMGFYPKVWKKQDLGLWDSFSSGIASITVGTASIFKTTASLGGGISPVNNKDNVTLNEGREADERLSREMLKGAGYDPGTGSIGEAFRKLIKDKARPGSKSFTTYVDASNYGRYRVFTQVCNDFTDDMLDKYYGYNWYTGPIWFGSSWTGYDNGLIDDLRAHEQRMNGLKDAASSALSPLTDPGMIQDALDTVGTLLGGLR